MSSPLRVQFLNTAAQVTDGDRNKAYGEPHENYSCIAELMTAYLRAKYLTKSLGDVDFALTTEDAAWLMVLTKMARSFHSYKPDTYIDAAAYAAIAGECRAIDEELA